MSRIRMNALPPERPAPTEKPELNNERDIPSEPDDGHAPEELEESIAGEEDPGAALDAPEEQP
ncbi:MAG: hypothetical protein ACOZJX_00275 [Pseudomonadota bacterium]